MDGAELVDGWCRSVVPRLPVAKRTPANWLVWTALLTSPIAEFFRIESWMGPFYADALLMA